MRDKKPKALAGTFAKAAAIAVIGFIGGAIGTAAWKFGADVLVGTEIYQTYNGDHVPTEVHKLPERAWAKPKTAALGITAQR